MNTHMVTVQWQPGFLGQLSLSDVIIEYCTFQSHYLAMEIPASIVVITQGLPAFIQRICTDTHNIENNSGSA